jgi:branched-chain amino acid transport system permease protein
VSEGRRRLVGRVAVAALVAFLLWLPQYAEGFWLQTGLFAMSAAIGAIGLTLLVGITGQLSLAHAFFIAIGAYGYCFLAGGEAPPGASSAPSGLGLPPLLAAIGAVLLAGAAGSRAGCVASTSASRRSASSSSASTSSSTPRGLPAASTAGTRSR